MKVTKSQNKDFGIVLTLAFILAGILSGEWIWIYLALVFVAVTAIFPSLYKPFTWAWFWLARVLEKIMTNLLLSAVYCLVVTPVGLLRRMKRRTTTTEFSTFQDKEHKYKAADFEKQFIDY